MKKSVFILLTTLFCLGWGAWSEARTYVVRPGGGNYYRGYYPRAYYPRPYYRPYYYPYSYYPRPYFYAAPFFGPFGYYGAPYYYPGYYGSGVNVYYNTPGFSISVGSGY
ncbi:MAG: hypothetical protein IT573_02880 [Deltaproteobacteria bacterium]|nr:hypothetical protein [Deltaproteobacteria bacterium]